MKKLHPELKSLEAEVAAIADFSGMPKAKIGGVAISKVLDAETNSKNAAKPVVEALKNIGKVAKEKAEENKAKIKEVAEENIEKIKAAVKPAAPAPEPVSSEDTSGIS